MPIGLQTQHLWPNKGSSSLYDMLQIHQRETFQHHMVRQWYQILLYLQIDSVEHKFMSRWQTKDSYTPDIKQKNSQISITRNWSKPYRPSVCHNNKEQKALPFPNILLRLFSWYGRGCAWGFNSMSRSGLTCDSTSDDCGKPIPYLSLDWAQCTIDRPLL